MARSAEVSRALQMFVAGYPGDPATWTIEDIRGFESEFWQDEVFAPASDAEIVEMDAGGVPALLVSIPDRQADRIVVWCHGGGFFLGSAASRRRFGADVARAADCQTLLVDYRLAPEHKFPAAVDDTLAACRWASERFGPERVLVGGDSAGGALAVSAVLRLRDEGLPQVAGAIPMSAMVDLTVSGASIERNASAELMAGAGRLRRQVRDWYLAEGHDPEDPFASPVHANLAGLPPMLVLVGSAEPLCDDSLRLAKRATDAGSPVELVVAPEMFHMWPMFTEFLPEAREAVDTIADFIQRRSPANEDRER